MRRILSQYSSRASSSISDVRRTLSCADTVKLNSSHELRVMLRPASTYRQLVGVSDESGIWLMLRRPVFVAFVVGSFTSFTVSGHLTLSLLLDGMVFWSFVPLVQAILMAGIVALFARRRIPTSKAIDLFFMGHGPWLLWLLIVSGTCLFFPLKSFYLWPVEWGWVLPVSLFAAWIWSSLTSFAFLREALEVSRLSATGLLVLYTVLLWAIFIALLVLTETIPLHRITSLS